MTNPKTSISWEDLKEHCRKQMGNYDKANAGKISSLGKGIWRDVLNKMWSLEQEEKKEVEVK